MLACLLLDESEDEVALAEREGLDLLVVVVPQALLEMAERLSARRHASSSRSTPSSRASLASASVYIMTRGESNSTSVGMTASAP